MSFLETFIVLVVLFIVMIFIGILYLIALASDYRSGKELSNIKESFLYGYLRNNSEEKLKKHNLYDMYVDLKEKRNEST